VSSPAPGTPCRRRCSTTKPGSLGRPARPAAHCPLGRPAEARVETTPSQTKPALSGSPLGWPRTAPLDEIGAVPLLGHELPDPVAQAGDLIDGATPLGREPRAVTQDPRFHRVTTAPLPRRCLVYAGHVQPLGGASPLWRLMAPTTSQGQLRRREAGWEGSRRRIRDPRDTNRIGGGAARASQHAMAKPDVIKGPSRKCGGCAVKVAGLIPGDLSGCRRMPVQRDGAVRRVGCDGGGREAAARGGEVSRGRSTGGIVGRREGPNAKPSARTFVLVAVALTAANPGWGLTGRVGG